MNSKKKIAVLVSNPCTIDARVIRMSEAESDLGYDVKVFATLKDNLPQSELQNEVLYERYIWNLSEYCRKFIPGFVKNKRIKGFLVKRLAKYLRYYSFQDTFLECVIAYKPDIIHAHDLLCLPLGASIKKVTGAKLIYDAHELELHRNPPMPWYEKSFTKYIECKYSKHADCINTVNKSISDILTKNLKRPVYFMRNTPIIDSYSGKSLRENAGLKNEDKILIYVGKVSSNRGIEWVIDGLQDMHDIHFVCVGHQDKTTMLKIESQIHKLSLENRVHFLPPVSHSQVVSYIEEADVGVCAINPVTKSYYYSLPNKVFEMSMAGLPVVATDLPEIRSFLDEVGNGYYFSHTRPQDLTKKVLQVFDDLKKNNKKFKAKAQIAREHSWQNEAKKLKDILNAIQ